MKKSNQAERGNQVQQLMREREPLECKCGGGMTERLAKLLPYQVCKGCGSVYAPLHRPEGQADRQEQHAKKSRLAAASSSQDSLF
jgi:hypothetical protein